MSPPSSPRNDPSSMEDSSRLLGGVYQGRTERSPLDVVAHAAALQLGQGLPSATPHRTLNDALFGRTREVDLHLHQSLFSTLHDAYAVIPRIHARGLSPHATAMFPQSGRRDTASLPMPTSALNNPFYFDARDVLARSAYTQQLQRLTHLGHSNSPSIVLPPPEASPGMHLPPSRMPMSNPVRLHPQRVVHGQAQYLPGILQSLHESNSLILSPWPQRTLQQPNPHLALSQYEAPDVHLPGGNHDEPKNPAARFPEETASHEGKEDSSSQASSLDEKIAALSQQRKASPTDSKPKSFPSERSSLSLNGDCESPGEAYQILQVLGSTLRSKADPFIDAASLPAANGPECKRVIRGTDVFFPDQLHLMLSELESDESQTNVVSFLPHGRAFRVHNKERFIAEILPKYFGGQGKWTSFLRQLKLYGFLRVSSGPDKGAYYHELFLRKRTDLLQYMRRVGTPKGLDRRTYRLAGANDPDFYNLPPLQD